MKRNRLKERADIESALELAVERGEVVADYRERTGHSGDSFGALKNAENKLRLENVTRRLEHAFERNGVGSDQFNGTLHEYLWLLNASWYQNSHTAVSEHREDLVTDLYIKMIDPANSGSGASIYSFKGVRDDGKPVPVHRFVNSVFRTFFMEKERTQRDYAFKHFRLIDDNAPFSQVGDVRVGQIDRLAMPFGEEEKQQNVFADLKVFRRGVVEFATEFENRSDVHRLVVALLRQNADFSAPDIAHAIKTTTFTVMSGGEPIKVIKPIDVHVRTVQRVRKEFLDGIRNLFASDLIQKEQEKKAANEKIGVEYKVADISDPQVLADRVYRAMMARAGKPVRRHPVETKESRAKAQKADPNHVEKTFSNDGVRFGGSRKRTNMDSDFDKDGGSNIF